MGTTLEHGVYLPDEGERNCYAGLKLNWETLDQKVADISALQSAIAGALHREIVVSLPTTDIDPNTIYMILSGTSATENVYNEFMYVNNAWELIGTSATDLTNYYTKGDVDGLLLLKANASDLTSHTGDTTIHVTASDKAKWNNGVSQAYVLRYSSTAITDNSTIAYSTIDNTDNIKAGDKIIDVDGKIFSIVSVDSDNSTVTVGTALIDVGVVALPIGSYIQFAGSQAPDGFLVCNGGAVSRTTYSKLFAVIGTTYGSGDGSTTFNLPNLTDRFLQGSTTVGTYKSAGLPDITGWFNYNCTGSAKDVTSTGAFDCPSGTVNTHTPGSGGVPIYVGECNFNASRSSSIYGNSATVQPPALTCLICIKY